MNITQLWAQSTSSRAESWFTDITGAAVGSDPDPANIEIQFPGVTGYECVWNGREAAVCDPAPTTDIHTRKLRQNAEESAAWSIHLIEKREGILKDVYLRANVCLAR